MNSNYTLRFPRTYREATGHDCNFNHRDPDRLVGVVVLVLCAFVVGMMVGGL